MAVDLSDYRAPKALFMFRAKVARSELLLRRMRAMVGRKQRQGPSKLRSNSGPPSVQLDAASRLTLLPLQMMSKLILTHRSCQIHLNVIYWCR